MWKLIKRKHKADKKSKKIKRSCIELEISGYNIERTLNFLCSKNIEFFEIEKFDIKNARIQIKQKDKAFVEKYLIERKIEINNEKYLGALKIFHFFKLRYGILIGLFISFALVVILSNFILKIDVQGTEKVNSNEIVVMLNENGITPFTHLNNVSTEDVEKLIMDNFDKISSVSAIKKGCSIVINVKEKVVNDDFENLDNLTPLLATQDGMITDITLIQGTLLVKVGDVVKVGDPLVAPYTLDSSGKKISIIPKANIIADVWITGKAEHCERVAKKDRTGKSISFRQSTAFEQILFSNIQDVPFENYDVEEKTCYLSDYIIPIKYKEIFYFETKCVIIEKKFEEVKEEIMAEAKKNALIQIVDENDIKKEDFSIAQNGDKWVVTYTVTIAKNIAV